jgi:hypothetical protein
MRKKGLAAILAIAFLLITSVSLAGDELEQRALRGLNGVYVLVEVLNPEAERLGLTQDQIKTDVELRLRKAGVRVLTNEDRYKTPGMPYLYVNVNTSFKSGTGLCAHSVGVELKEMVMLARRFETVGSIWRTGSVGTVGIANIKELRGSVGDLVDEFINDYLAANPNK